MTGLGSQQIPGGLTERQTKPRTNLRARVWSPELLGTGSLPAVCSWQPQLPKPLEALGALGPPDLDFSPSSNAIQGAASGQLPPSLHLSCILRELPELQPPSPAAGLRNTPPAAAQPSCSRHCPCATPARPRNLETERKHPMPPRSTQSVLGSTPPPNLSDCSKAWERERAHAVAYGRLGSDQGRASERRTQGCEAAAESAARTAESGPHTPLQPGAGLQASVRAQGLRKRGRWADPHPGVWSLGSGRASSLPHALGQVSVNSSHNTDHGLIKMK